MTKSRTLADIVSTGSPLADGAIATTDITGVTVSAAEINYLDGVTSDLQTQLDSISVTVGTLTKSFANGESATITLSSSVSPTALVAVTKEVNQTGASSKGAWDVNATASNYELYNEAPATSLTLEGWDVSNASFLQSFSVASQETDSSGLFFKPDGTKMYVVGTAGDDVNEYNLSTAWDISTASYSQNFSVASDAFPRGLFFKPDGTKMYIAGDQGDDVKEYNLSTAWDISTASYSQDFSVASQEASPRGLFFKPDGTKMYVVGGAGDDINEYDLSTAWDISTASFNQNFSVASQETSPFGVFFKPDGTKMYVVGSTGDDVNEYNLGTAWDVSTASFLQNFSVSGQEGSPVSLFFKPDGTKMYVVGDAADNVNEYDISLVAILGTGSFSSSDVGKRIFVDDGGEATLINANGTVSIVSDFGASTYTSGNWSLSGLDADADDGITLSQISTGWDVSGATYSQSLSVSAQGTNPQSVFFKPDGTRMYVVGYTSDDVDEYDLSTAWDVSTATYSRGFNVAAQESNPNALFFKPDGTKMYVLGQQGDDVNEYSLSTAWNVTTASISATGSIAAQETTPYGLFFRDDGTKMYVSGQSGEDVNEYNLSTAWDVSTLVFVQNKSVSSQTAYPQAISFKADGTKMFVLGQINDDVYEYNLSTAWDVSTAVYSQAFSTTAQDTDPTGMFWKPDGTRMYIVGQGNDSVYEYDVGALYQPTAQYLPAITSAGGQIDSTYWTDINSMTADDVDGDGQVYYAVSTDDRTTWSVAKASDGVRNIVRDNGGTWQYNSAADGWALENAAYVQAFDVSAQDTEPEALTFKPDGTKMYVVGDTGNDVNEYDLSTAWDISSASFNQNFSVGGQESRPNGIYFKTDGTKMYIIGESSDSVHEYNLSTAWDVSTASFLQSFSVSSQESLPSGLFFKPDGSKMYVVGFNGDEVNEYDLSTAWNVSTASFNQNFSLSSQDTTPRGIFFKSDGTIMYMVGDTNDSVYDYYLSTAWDISTASFNQSFSVSSEDSTPGGVAFKSDGTKMYVVGRENDSVYEYNTQAYTTSETWVNATTNDEFAAVAQAMSIGPNQMDKAQIDAVTDGSHFTLGTTLDLAIIPYLGSAGTAPTSDGVSINYDAAVLNKGAILGTDYDYDVPANDKVRITALAANNLKVRVV